MSDISVNIIKILNDNGVSVQIENIWGNTGTNPKVVRRNINLDFSEHDKVFEDKIAELKKDYKTASELLEKYQQENESLKKRVVELENFSCQAEQETESLVEKLNQRIVKLEKSRSEWIDKTVEWQQKCEKLESKETEIVNEMPDSITIDGYKCKIIKTENGLYISRDEIYSIIDKEKEPLKQKCKELEDKHQSDCIEINRLNTAIDVLIHKVEYLRQFVGLE